MTSFGEFPLVYQKQLKDGVLIPVGLAESSSLGSFSAVNIVVSSISATDYLGFEQNVSFTGILSIVTTGTGTQLMDVVTDPNNPVIRSLATPTNNFIAPSLAGNGTVQIGYGGDPLSYSYGGTNSTDIPSQNNVAFWYNDGSQTRLKTDGKLTYDTGSSNLSLGSGGQYQINGSQLALTDLANVNAPGSANTFLKWNGTNYIWTGVAGGGSVTLPGTQYAVIYEDPIGTLASNSTIKIQNGVFSASNVSATNASAQIFTEGGQALSTKYQSKDDTLTTIASLNPGTNQFIYFTNTNVAATATVSPCALELLNDSTFADMRTTLQLNTYYQPTGLYLTAIPSEYLTQTEADGIYQPCNVFLTTLATNGNVQLDSDVVNTLPVTNGGTGATTFTDKTVVFYDSSLAPARLTGDTSFKFENNTLKSPNVCATTVCATTFQEGGQALSTKYLTTTAAAATYQVCDVFLNTLATNDAVRLDLDVTNTLGVARGGTGATTFELCAVVFMNAAGTSLTANNGIKINNSASTLNIFSDSANGTGGIDLSPEDATEGFVRWDHDYDTLGVQGINNTRIALGVDEVIPISNKTGSTISKGQVVWVSSADSAGFHGQVGLLASDNTSAKIIGVALADVANNSTGYAIKKGLIKNVPLASVKKTADATWVENNILYVSDELGKMTSSAPAPGVFAATMGIVLKISGSNVTFGVLVDRGYDLSELHDVAASPTSNGETLVWNTAGYYTTGTINSITGTLAVNKGGTGKTSFAANQLIYGSTLSQDSNLYYSNNVLYASAASATTNVSAGGSIYGGNASIAGFILATGDIATIAGTIAGANVCGTNLFQNGVNINAIYQPTGSYQPNSTRLHELTAVSVDGLLRFNGSNYVTQPTATYETTAYARNTYETTGYARSTYETTGYARNTYETTGYARNTYETTGYARSTYETTGYSRNNYETTAYSRVNFATTASLNNYTTTATFNTFSQGVTDNKGIVFANGTNLDTTNTLFFEGATNTLRSLTVSSDTTYFNVGAVSKSAADTLAFYTKPTYAGTQDSNGSIFYVTGAVWQDIGATTTFTFDESNNRLKVTNISATNYNNLALSSQLSDVNITAPITTGYALKWDGSKWTPQQDQTGGAGATPVGVEGSIQYYREGAFSGDANLTYVTGTTTLRSPNVCATTYLNLPSGTATWNANKIQGVSVTGGAPITANLLFYDYPVIGSYVWQYYGALDFANTNIFNASKLQNIDISTATPSTNNTLVYNGTAWTPKPSNGIASLIGNNLIL